MLDKHELDFFLKKVNDIAYIQCNGKQKTLTEETLIKSFMDNDLDIYNLYCTSIIDNVFMDFYYLTEDFNVPLRVNTLPVEYLIDEIKKGLKLEEEVFYFNGDINDLLFLVEKRWYISFFNDNYFLLDKRKRRKAFRNAYTCIEDGFSRINNSIMEDSFILDDKEKTEILEQLSSLPDTLTVYRGQGTKSTPLNVAKSWTLDLKTAIFFANRWSNDGKVYKAKIKKENILYYTNDRNEQEIILNFPLLYDIEEEN